MLTLFPPYLNAGSTGTAVAHLQGVICSMDFGEAIARDGEYGKVTVAAVKGLQTVLALGGTDVDGNFGPVTRKALKDEYVINVDLIPYSPTLDSANKWQSPNFEGSRGWKGGDTQDLEDINKDGKE